jgi:hypothetical protein
VRAGIEVDVDTADAPGPELDVAGAGAVVGRRGAAANRGDDRAATARAAPSAKTPAFGVPVLAMSPTA